MTDPAGISTALVIALQDALALQGRSQTADAVAALEAILRTWPGQPQALQLLGLLYCQQQDYTAARPLLERALAAGRPAKLLLILATCLDRLDDADGALAALDEIIAAAPDHVEARSRRALLLHRLRRFARAQPDFDFALAARPDRLDLRLARLQGDQQLCRWLPDEDEIVFAMLQQNPDFVVTDPLSLTFSCDDPALLRDCAERLAGRIVAAAVKPPGPGPRAARDDGRIRVGYLSGDFRNHAVAQVTAGLFALHDRAVFDIRLLSVGRDDGSTLRRHFAAQPGFTELYGLDDAALALALRDCGLDILVDLQGYTGGSRTALLAGRLAPVQVNWLGYAGTLGRGMADYILADATVIPPGAEAWYAEQVVRLPHSYLPFSRDRAIATPPSRPASGLPEDAVVFCSFARPVKIRPAVFATWLDILRAVPGSVLWLFEQYLEASANLRHAAGEAGIDPARLIFARPTADADYLARYRLADIVLDTFPYGSHSTAAEALWAGCPLLTLEGRGFVARVAASQLRAAGLDSLVMPDLAAYRDRAIALGRNRAALADLRRRIETGRDAMPLFDPAAFVAGLEAALRAMWDIHRSGAAPRAITLNGAG